MTLVKRERGPRCEICLKPVEVGQVVLSYDDVGEVHADCEHPFSTKHERQEGEPAPVILLGEPMVQVPLSAITRPCAPADRDAIAEAKLLLNLHGVDPAKWSATEMQRLFDFVRSVAEATPSVLAESTSNDCLLVAEGWQPKIGEQVHVTEEVEDWHEWQRTPLYVVGVCAERNKEGLNVTVTEEWPPTSRSSGFTDDFWINRPFKSDMLRPGRSLDLSGVGVG